MPISASANCPLLLNSDSSKCCPVNLNKPVKNSGKNKSRKSSSGSELAQIMSNLTYCAFSPLTTTHHLDCTLLEKSLLSHVKTEEKDIK